MPMVLSWYGLNAFRLDLLGGDFMVCHFRKQLNWNVKLRVSEKLPICTVEYQQHCLRQAA